MIKHHPSETLLTQYCAATLPASLSLAVSIHVDMCPVCQAKVEKLEAANARAVLVTIWMWQLMSKPMM